MCETDRHDRRHTPASRESLGQILGLKAIRLYQLGLSPLLGPRCRYAPSCSHYTAEAIARFGFWAGGWMGLARLLRCHPWSASGHDPVPEARDPAYRWYRPWRGARWSGSHIDPATRLDTVSRS